MMNTAPTAAAIAKEIGFAKPENYNRNQDQFINWWQLVQLYLKENEGVYQSDN